MEILDLGGSRWALGLEWRRVAPDALARPRRYLRSEVRGDDTRRPDAYVVLPRAGVIGTAETGLARREIGSVRPLAPLLAARSEGGRRVLVRYRIRADRVWVLAAQDGAIVPGGDHLDGPEGAADHLERLRASYGSEDDPWEEIEEDNVEVVLARLEKLAAEAPEGVARALAPLAPSRLPVLLGIGGLLAALAVGGGLYAVHRAEVRRARAEARREAALARERLLALRRAQAARFRARPPAPEATDPSVLVGRCRTAWGETPLARGEYVLTRAACGGDAFTTWWRPAGGAVPVPPLSGARAAAGGLETLSTPLDVPARVLRGLPPPAQAERLFWGWAREEGFRAGSVRFSWSRPALPSGKGRGPSAGVSVRPQAAWEARTRVVPWAALRDLVRREPGLDIGAISVALSPASGHLVWYLQGEIYAR